MQRASHRSIGFRTPAAFAALAMFLGMPHSAFAAWQPDGTVIGTVGSWVASDARGGMFVVDAGPYGLTGLILHYDSSGDPAAGWPQAGIPMVPGNNKGIHDTIGPIAAMPDGRGGLYVLTLERGPYPGSGGFLNPFQIYLHRRDASGAPARGWTYEGVRVETVCLSPPSSANNLPVMASDGEGGVLVAWLYSWWNDRSLWAQRVRADGSLAWGENGVLFRNATSVGSIPSICSDDRGGALVFWGEWDATATRIGIRAQHLSPTGSALWDPAGRVASSRAFSVIEQSFPANTLLNYSPHSRAIFPIPDDAGGAILAWSAAAGGNLQIFMTRLSRDGQPSWGSDLQVCPSSGHQRQLTWTETQGRAMVATWLDQRDPVAPAVFAQSVSLEGRVRWEPNGVPVAVGAGDRSSPVVQDDGRGTVLIVWGEAADGGVLRAQRLSMSGRPAPGWPENGKLISAMAHVTSNFHLQPQVTDAGHGSSIVSWNDLREAPSPLDFRYRLLGTLVTPGGPAGPDSPPLVQKAIFAQASPSNDGVGQFFLRKVPPGTDEIEFGLAPDGPATLEIVDVAGRRMATRNAFPAGVATQRVRIADERELRTGVYFVRLTQGSHLAIARVSVIR